MAKCFQWISAALLVPAWVGLVLLVVTDGLHRFQITAAHQHIVGIALLAVGLAFVAFQVGNRRPARDKVKGALLGAAFMLWGGEQLLPACPVVTAMDALVIAFFVADISLVMVE